MSVSPSIRRHLPVVVLAAVPLLLALRFGGYHPRHAGWAVLGLAGWACVQAARGKLSTPRSASGIATIAMLVLVVWTTLSISWVDVSRHDAWVEAMRAAGYAAIFVLGGSLLAHARSYARFAAYTGGGIALLGLIAVVRMSSSSTPLKAFVAGRLDWPIGYAPGMAGMALIGLLLMLGIAGAAEARWIRHRSTIDLLAGGATLGAAGLCASVAMLAQSRGTIPALAVGIVVSLIAMPQRASWLLRLVAIAAALGAARHALAAPFQTQFDLRQAPFTTGADADQLLARAEDASRHAASMVLVITVVLAIVGVALVPIGAALMARIQSFEARLGVRLAVPVTAGVLALTVALVALSVGRDTGPGGWMRDQWHGCRNPPERVNDPGSGRSYFANTGTGRCDYYRVAAQSIPEHPILGLGAGNFRGEYVRERRTAEEPRVVHSLPLQLLAELGLVGGLLGATVLGSLVWGALRFVNSGSARDPAFAGAIGALGYWVAHASIDWLWQLPAVSMPALALAGGLVACVSPAQRRVRATVAAPIAAGVLLGCIGLVLPVAMADAQLRLARDPELRREHPKQALAAARDAHAFDPTWAEPKLTEAVLLAASGFRSQAADAARRAVKLEPRNWAVQYDASGLIGLDSTAEGLAAFQTARRLNPSLPAQVARPARPATTTAAPDSQQTPNSATAG